MNELETETSLIYYFRKLENTFYLISVREKDSILKVLLQYFLSDDIFSINQEINGAYSLLIKAGIKDKFMSDITESYGSMINTIIMEEEEYNSVQVSTSNPGINEIGMLNEVTGLFTSLGIPILCISTYDGNHIYYPRGMECKFQEGIKKQGDKYKID
jgi:hypothetical protein